MSKLTEKINQELKQAMKSKDAETTSVLRLLIAALHNKEISLRQGEAIELTEEQALEVVSSEIKKRRDSVELYVQGGRSELADKEIGEIKILEKYLPKQLSDAELEKIIKGVIEAHGQAPGQKDFGRIMGQVMAKVKGRTDGGKVGGLVKKILTQINAD